MINFNYFEMKYKWLHLILKEKNNNTYIFDVFLLKNYKKLNKNIEIYDDWIIFDDQIWFLKFENSIIKNNFISLINN